MTHLFDDFVTDPDGSERIAVSSTEQPELDLVYQSFADDTNHFDSMALTSRYAPLSNANNVALPSGSLSPFYSVNSAHQASEGLSFTNAYMTLFGAAPVHFQSQLSSSPLPPPAPFPQIMDTLPTRVTSKVAGNNSLTNQIGSQPLLGDDMEQQQQQQQQPLMSADHYARSASTAFSAAQPPLPIGRCERKPMDSSFV